MSSESPFAFEAEEPQAPEFHLSQVVGIIRRRLRLILAVVGACLGVALLSFITTPKAFRATTILQIERRAAGMTRMEDLLTGDSWWDAQTFYPTQFRLLKSRGLAERVVATLRLQEDPIFTGGEPLAAGSDLPAATAASMAGRVLAGLTVSPIRDTRLVEISYAAPTADLAARVANGMADEYISWIAEKSSSTVGRASSSLTTQIETLKREIQDREDKLQAFRQRTDIVSPDPKTDASVQRLESLNRDYSTAVSSRIALDARVRQLETSPRELIAESLSGDVVGQLRSELAKLESEYASKLATYKPEFPAMQDLRDQITQGRKNLSSVIDQTVSEAIRASRAQYQLALRNEQSLAAEISRLKGDVLRLNSASVEYNNLNVEVSTRRALLDELVRRLSETEVASSLGTNRASTVTVVDRALVPGGPYRPSLLRNLALGSALGLLLAGGLVVLLEFLDRTVKTVDDVERVAALPVLAVIPELGDSSAHGYGYGYGSSRRSRRAQEQGGKKAAVGATAPATPAAAEHGRIELLPHEHPHNPVSEAYRSLRTALLLSRASGLHCFAVSSALPGEGKTSTAVNIATVLAQLGKGVLLVDADLRKARAHEVFGVSNRLGLVSYLTGATPEIPIVARTPVPGLCVVPAGPQPPNPAELLASPLMAEFIAEVRSRFDYVVFDTPPVLPVTDPTVLGGMVDGLVICVGAGMINREDLRACERRLRTSGVHILGVVLNHFHAMARGYGYRSYAYTAGEESTGAPPAPDGPQPSA